MPASVPILTRDGRPLVDAKGRTSYVRSAGSGPSLGAYLLTGYLPPEHAEVGTELSVGYSRPVCGDGGQLGLDVAVRP
jgi:glycine cleavage system aminomethyltransferase T